MGHCGTAAGTPAVGDTEEKRGGCDVLQGDVSAIDEQFARLLLRLSGTTGSPELWQAAVLVSGKTREGHVCLDLAALAGDSRPSENGIPVVFLSDWIAALRRSAAVGRPGDFRPLILDDRGRLYLYRYWRYEKTVADFLRQGAETTTVTDRAYIAAVRDTLSQLFPSRPAGPSGQKIAAAVAAFKKITVISGSPGTGKTSTVARIMALLIAVSRAGRLRVALTAPTGKAAARLQEAIGRAKESLPPAEAVRAAVPLEAMTIHRLIGALPHAPSALYTERNPLPFDLVVVDEASMVDLPLMAKLAAAMPHAGRLILLGDKDQLASVEAGAVLGDICGDREGKFFSPRFHSLVQEVAGADACPPAADGGSTLMQDCVVTLRENYRFRAGSGIALSSAAVNRGDAEAALSIMNSGNASDIGWMPLPEPSRLSVALGDYLVSRFLDYLHALDTGQGVRELLAALDRFRVLCALREGPWGALAVNRLIENRLRQRGSIKDAGRWYHGRPVMVTRNDHGMKLFNGDVGVVVHDGPGGAPSVCFPDAHGGLRRFAPLRLPEHETVFAVTVHKSQGSEFDHVCLLLPDRDSPVLSRELIYTGITRARERVDVWGNRNVFRSAVARRIRRASGLRDALWGDTGR